MSKIFNSFFIIIAVFINFGPVANARPVCTEVQDNIGGQITHLLDGSTLFENPTIQYGSQTLQVQGDVGLSTFTGANGKAFCRLSHLRLVHAESNNFISDKSSVVTLESNGNIAGTAEGSFTLSSVLCR